MVMPAICLDDRVSGMYDYNLRAHKYQKYDKYLISACLGVTEKATSDR